MTFSFLFYLFFIFETVISASLGSISNNKIVDNEIKIKEPLSDILNTLDSDKSTLITIINDHHKILTVTEKSKTFETSIPKRIKDDPLLMEIFSSVPKDIPTVLINIMGDYIYHDDTINEFHDRIRNELEIIGEKVIPDLYDPNFVSNLLNLVNINKEKISREHAFWYDLERFLFKYALAMKRKFAKNDQLFEKSVESVKDIMIIMRKRIRNHVNMPKIESVANFDFFIFKNLMGYEIFDHLYLLELLFKKILDNQGTLIMTLDEIEQEYCNGSFNNDPLLKMMIIQCAFGSLATSQLLKRGWITMSDGSRPRKDLNFAIALYHVYSKVECGNETCLIEHLRLSYLSQSIVKFFNDNNLRFRILDSSYLVLFLRRIDHIGGLTKEVSLIERITKFKDEKDEKIFKWNKNTFEKYLIEEREKNEISQEEYNRFIKIIE